MISEPKSRNFYLPDFQAVAELLGFEPKYLVDLHITVDYIDASYVDPDVVDPAGMYTITTYRHFITHQTPKN